MIKIFCKNADDYKRKVIIPFAQWIHPHNFSEQNYAIINDMGWNVGLKTKDGRTKIKGQYRDPIRGILEERTCLLDFNTNSFWDIDEDEFTDDDGECYDVDSDLKRTTFTNSIQFPCLIIFNDKCLHLTSDDVVIESVMDYVPCAEGTEMPVYDGYDIADAYFLPLFSRNHRYTNDNSKTPKEGYHILPDNDFEEEILLKLEKNGIITLNISDIELPKFLRNDNDADSEKAGFEPPKRYFLHLKHTTKGKELFRNL